MQDNIQDLAAALNDHQITDDEGKMQEESTSFENTAVQETNTVEESETAEKSVEPALSAPKAPSKGTENATTEVEAELAEDEAGKRYVPEQRFKEVYAKQKEHERENQILKAQLEASKIGSRAVAQEPVAPAKPLDSENRSNALESELLRATLPQFNPESDQYSPALDQLGAEIYKARMEPDKKGNLVPTITKLEAARLAIKRAKDLQSKEVEIVAEARAVKASQSDQGITNRVSSRGASQPNPDNMSDKELEAYLRSTNQW